MKINIKLLLSILLITYSSWGFYIFINGNIRNIDAYAFLQALPMVLLVVGISLFIESQLGSQNISEKSYERK